MTAASGIPAKYQLYWAQNAGGSFVLTPPAASNPTPGGASYNDGFPPTNMTLGGIPPFGRYMNGALRAETQWSQWFQMGGPVSYDATFQGQVSGYPAGSLIQSASILGLFWFSTVDNNATNPDAAGAGWSSDQPGVFPQTGAQLQFTNATTLTLAALNGGFLWINPSGQANGGLNYPVPAGTTISNGGLAANTLYYIYAKVAGGALVLDTPSTTGYALAANGIPQKSGDVTRTLVGMVRTNGANQFASQDGSLFVRTYFQRQLTRTRTNFSTNQTSSTATLAEIDTSIRNSFLVWSGENVEFSMSGSTTTTANSAVSTISFDGGSPELESCAAGGPSTLALNGVKTGLAEGLHYATLFGAINTSGTATWRGGAAPSGSGGTAPVSLTLGLGR
jgi:hypothetical protein